jgi:hypothetical protein
MMAAALRMKALDSQRLGLLPDRTIHSPAKDGVASVF